MDAFLPALVGAAIAEAGDKSPWLAALIAARTGRVGQVVAGAIVAAVAASALSALGGALVQPLLTPNARLLFLGIALAFGGFGLLMPLKMPDPLAGWRIGAFLTSAFGLFILQFGEGGQFLIAGLAVNAKVPALAAAGGAIGILAVTVPAVIAGPALYDRLPVRAIRIAAAVPFLLAGLWSALAALRIF